MECQLGNHSIYYKIIGEGKLLVTISGIPSDHRIIEYCKVVIAARPQNNRSLIEKRLYSFDLEALTDPFEKPTLILTGRQDTHVGYKDAWEILEKYPRATFAVLDLAGHALGVEQAGLFQALIHEWLDRVEEMRSNE